MKKSCYDLSPTEIKRRNQENPFFTTREAFEEALKQLGVAPGIRLVVHSSMGSLGTFEGGPENFCNAIRDLVTEAGTLLFPGLTRYPRSGSAFEYDPETTPSRVGIAAETFRTMPGVIRSWDPTHSFCAWGKDKLEYVRRHHLVPTMHADSPLGLLEKAGGFCLLVGCMESTTFMHVVETSCPVQHCLGSRAEEYPAVICGQKVKLRAWNWRDGCCRALRHGELFNFMREQKTLRESMLGYCHLMFFKLSDYRTAYERLLNGPRGCVDCPVKPRVVQQSVESDWDFEHNRLKETDAFTGPYVANEKQI